MIFSQCLRFLRPYVRVRRDLSTSRNAAYLQFYYATRTYSDSAPSRSPSNSHNVHESSAKIAEARGGDEDAHTGTGAVQRPVSIPWLGDRSDDVRKRVAELHAAGALKYPRIKHDRNAITCAEFRNRYQSLKPGESSEGESVTLRGRVYSSRIAGSKLVFIDLFQDGCKVQGLCNQGKLATLGVDTVRFKEFYHLTRRGDIISITGTPSRTKRGELSLNATGLPIILSPTLASLPTTLEDRETRIRYRHADLLVNQRTADTLKLRSHTIQYLRNFLITHNFLEVQTPILADGAGGAVARPFLTAATEFRDKILSLRIAPEIWLKRLVLGGVDRVFEIGPAFRNEGLDATHNPEFTTCEFYKSFADLEELINITESFLSGLALHVNKLIESRFTALQAHDISHYARPFKRIEFVPALEAATGRKLPDLTYQDATEQLASLFSDLSIHLPSSPTLPRLLDKLSSHYLEPQCIGPTFITHHPACLAPLAKSFQDLKTKQLVSARAELFVQKCEIANMYEEENSPFEQRRKFVQQGQWRDNENGAVIDENYLEALEWGLPPTGGWGCGVDRLCMLFSGASRIGDVLAFGSLRNVGSLGQGT